MQIDKRSKLGRFMEHVMPGVVRPLRVLWHEIIGFIFIVLAVIFGSSAKSDVWVAATAWPPPVTAQPLPHAP